ncbi:TonB-dependent receptor [Carboxylicivirga mesophila]|uniref:TonB-dependent receptor n=1 Tax=Carboxylicivirga mesophila TaxID=1166478 RepID=A0ABS5KEN6_9BACT|nr:TonB-dependent receptor [Carboxylicivirga mesophila]MBS2213307.1 TonB-dependent receptor [Carboxylicivirga mesophila]
MNFKKYLWLIIALYWLSVLLVTAQEKYTISGEVTDAETGEVLIGVTIYTADKMIGTMTNTYGFYSLTLPAGQQTIYFSFVGYKTQQKQLLLNTNQNIKIALQTNETALNEVVVKAEKKDKNITSTQMAGEKLDMKTIDKLPVLFGERDVLKTIQLLPGISTVSEGGNGFSVRGGSIDQNLILLDEAPVYSASHLMGFFSVFNADAIKGMTVFKSGIPANYGGRAASVLDITMKDGNMKKLQGSGGIGLLASRITIEGPVVEDKVSFIISGRRSYADLMAKGANQIDGDTKMYFYDLNAKLNYKINDNNRLFLSGYFGKDDFGFDDLGMDWGNTTATLRWNHLFSAKLFSNTTALYSEYDYGFNFGDNGSMQSGIKDVSLKQDFTWYASPENTLRYGLNCTYHIFYPGEFLFEDQSISDIKVAEKQAFESSLYISNEQKIGQQLVLDYGLRASMFNQVGKGENITYDDDNNIIDKEYFSNGQIMQSYYGLEPRLGINYRLTPQSSFKASYNRMVQYLHLLSNSTSGQPTDTWTPSTYNIKPTTVNQYSVGWFRNFFDNTFEFSAESYYKTMNNISDYKDGTQVMLNEDIESYVLQGEGRSFGLELYLKKKYGKFTGWISYTLSNTENKIDGINNGQWYSSSYDKTHDVSIVSSYQLSTRLSVSANWIFYTGNAVTFPSGKYEFDGNQVPYYTERNGYRMPDYHRLDLNIHLEGKGKRRIQSSWDFSLYNLYNRMNAYTINFRENETNPNITEAVKLSLFGIVPSVTWNFKF